MPRPLSWLPRLPAIQRAVAQSVRSHYGRRDLEQLFALQPRAAGKLLEELSTTQVGTSRLVTRDVLAGFLEQVAKADDLQTVFTTLRENKVSGPQRQLRTLVQTDDEPVSLESLPEALTLDRGRLEVRFKTLEELAQTLYFVARALQDETVVFADRFEPLPESADALVVGNVKEMFNELRRLEAEHATRLQRSTAKIAG